MTPDNTPSLTSVLNQNLHPLTALELATLAQNKAYELPASEIEQRVFTRGGPLNNLNDDLDPLNALQRIENLSRSRKWMYFEVRNTLKHRAQAEAYVLVAESLKRKVMAAKDENGDSDAEVCEMVIEGLRYEDWKAGKQRINLWDVVAKRERTMDERRDACHS